MVLVACQSGLHSAEVPRETVELSVLTPDAGWEFRVREVRETPDAVWVWADLERREGPAAQQLTTVATQVDLPPGKARRVFVTGKTWAWENDEPYEFVPRAPKWPDNARPVAPTEREQAEEQ